MIKYFTYDSFDEYGQHITPINTESDLTKTAGLNYSDEIASVISSMIKKPEMYYVVINALGSYEVWGINGNGDAFPREALSHLSLRSDLGTQNDYGYKTFEYYAKLFKHHVNKPNSPSYGEVVFSHWNSKMDRVELIVGIDRLLAPDIVSALEKGENVAVSMGCKVPYDECSICGHRAKTRAQYCKHTKTHLRKIINEETARQWSIELGKEILPGTKVHVINRKPKFFDISKVHIGADRTAFVLGKAASDGDGISSVDVADAYGITDDIFDKVAAIGKSAILSKSSEIDKQVGSMSSSDVDGRMARISKAQIISKALKEKMDSQIEQEPEIDDDTLDTMAEKQPIGVIARSMLMGGMFPKPREFQRMVLVRAKHKNLADELDRRGMVFNHKGCDGIVPLDDGIKTDSIPAMLSRYMGERGFGPAHIPHRSGKIIIIKTSSQKIEPSSILEPIAEMYNGLKKYASSLRTSDMRAAGPASLSMSNVLELLGIRDGAKKYSPRVLDTPASEYEGMIVDGDFSGLLEYELDKMSSQIADALILPGAYINSAIEQDPMYDFNKTANLNWMSGYSDLSNFIKKASIDISNMYFNM